MNFTLSLPVHGIPLWFLILSLFLPRICILVAWVEHSMTQFIPPVVGLIPVIVAVLIPRVLILYWIYLDQGLGIWFLIHLLALLLVWGGSNTYLSLRWRRV